MTSIYRDWLMLKGQLERKDRRRKKERKKEKQKKTPNNFVVDCWSSH